jgi:uncharacterized membrane protein
MEMKLIIVRQARGAGAGWAAGLGLGAGLMFLLDPISGRRRRGLVRDKAIHASRVGSDAARKTATDLRHRGEGIAAAVRHRFEEDFADDDILEARVRSAIGMVCSHPGAIDVQVLDGRVTLVGPILAREAQKVIRKAGRVPGVRGLDDGLDRHATAENVPALQGGRRREARFEYLQQNWAPAPRLFAGLLGLGLSGVGLRMGGLAGGLATGTGGTLFLRAATNMPLARLFGVSGGRRGIDVRKDIHIQAPVEEVFGFFRNLENFPKFMDHLRSVRVSGERTHWEVAGPAGIPIRFEAEVTRFEPGKCIAWKSLPGSVVRSAGFVRFDDDGKGGTLLEVRMSYNPVGGAFAHAIATLFGADPKHALDDDLMRLKSILEQGRATAHGEKVHREDVIVGGNGAGSAQLPSETPQG